VILPAVLRFDRHVNELAVFSQQITIIIRRFWFVRHNRDDRSEFSDADLPDVKVGNE
jgi:hypothetical protein